MALELNASQKENKRKSLILQEGKLTAILHFLAM